MDVRTLGVLIAMLAAPLLLFAYILPTRATPSPKVAVTVELRR